MSASFDPSQIPVGTPPKGETSNLIDPVSLSWAGRLTVYACLPLMTIFVGMRLYVRIRSRLLGPDDFLCLVAAASIAAFCGQTLPLFLNDVYGRHFWDFPLSAFTNYYIKNVLVSGILYDIASIFTKVSLMVLYLRIFHPSRGARIAIWVGIVFNCVFYIACMISNICLCFPRVGTSETWVGVSESGRCGDPQLRVNAGQGIVSAITDLYALAIPISLVLKLHLSSSKKAGVVGIFLSGLFVCAISIAGAVYRMIDLLATTPDYTYLSLSVQALGVAELTVGLCCSCMPIVFVLFRGLSLRSESAWSYVRDLVRGRSRDTGKPSTAGSDAPFRKVEEAGGAGELPPVPKGTLSGLMSFVRGSGRTRGQPGASRFYKSGNGVTAVTETLVEMEPVDQSYHNYLHSARKDSQDARRAPRWDGAPHWQGSQTVIGSTGTGVQSYGQPGQH